MKNDSIIHLHDIEKLYHRGTETIHALHNCSLQIAQGEFILFMGASGSGKSTLLNIIGGLDVFDKGTYILNGSDVSSISEKEWIHVRRRWFGYIFQSFHLIPTLTVKENVELPAMFAHRKTTMERLDSILADVGLLHRKNHLPSQLSGGEMQRTAVARALYHKPSILIADEPTGNLDSHNAQAIFSLFTQLNKKYQVTILCATHDHELEKYSSRIVTMHDGSFV